MNTTLKKVLILGSGALKIGEAGEFDYSGSQAIKALKDEGVTTVLVNPNIATIQTSDYLADEVYFLPVTPYFVEQVIQKEQPDGVLLGFGGQTALNCGIALEQQSVFQRHGVRVLGTPVQTIQETEDRELFAAKLAEIDVCTPRSIIATSVQEAVSAAEEVGYPVMLRAAYALGGLGSGLCTSADEVSERAAKALMHSPQVLIEEYLTGWKEVEYEVVRDRFDNCVTVCNMENLDPMGIHTGESIVVAPSQTLTNAEYHALREVAIRTVRHLGVVGECNIQFALSPHALEYRVIEVNARLSRSSALASKATGYPLAYVAAKISLGYGLPELRNSITGVTTACFEPALDYVVVKIPRWDLRKFRRVSQRLGSGMKSVGEVMAIGRRFEEALQKALRMLEIGAMGLVGNGSSPLSNGEIEQELCEPTPERIFALPEAIKRGYSIDRIHQLSFIDKWFLYKIRAISQIEQDLCQRSQQGLSESLLREAKQSGFSDRQIARLTDQEEAQIRAFRETVGVRPCIKQIDTLAAEYPAQTNYLYLTYNGYGDDDIPREQEKTVIVLGSGAYRIGSSVEFDWCSVNTVQTLKQHGYRTIIINYNPETVSTDYNECDTLYFDELTLETVLAICHKEQPLGVVVSVGGQIPNNLAMQLYEHGVPILGTSPISIDTAEDRHKFSQLLDTLQVEQPEWQELTSLEDAKAFARRVGYPVLVRPSYVLSGAAMGVAETDAELVEFLHRATDISQTYPVVMSKFIENAQELEMDAVAQDGTVVASAISEHIERAGVHSGDATLVLPPQSTEPQVLQKIRLVTQQIAQALQINGPFNIQFLAKDGEVKVIECNLRASRSLPFVSKVLNVNFIELATKVLIGVPVAQEVTPTSEVKYVGVKAPQFSFTRLDGADPTLGVEMASTGEVGCLGNDFHEAFLKALLSVGYTLPVRRILVSAGPLENKQQFLSSAQILYAMGVEIYATRGTAAFLEQHQVPTTVLCWPLEEEQPNVLEYLSEKRIDLVINIPKNSQKEELTNDYIIRRRAVDFGIPLITNTQLAQHFIEALSLKQLDDLAIRSWNEQRQAFLAEQSADFLAVASVDGNTHAPAAK